MFVHTCSEKRVIAERVALELSSLHPRPPALRVFDAGVGDGTVLARVMRSMHGRFPHMPFYIAGKELSLEDVRLTLDKVPDRLFEHPATVVVLTNMHYAEAPWLTPASPTAAAGMIWHDVALRGASSGEFEAQIAGLGPFLDFALGRYTHISQEYGNESGGARIKDQAGHQWFTIGARGVFYP